MAQEDKLQGISENVITGQVPPVGTAKVLVRSKALTFFDLWQLQATFQQNNLTCRRRRLKSEQFQPGKADQLLISRVRKAQKISVGQCLAMATAEPEPGSGWRPREPKIGALIRLKYSSSRNRVRTPIGCTSSKDLNAPCVWRFAQCGNVLRGNPALSHNP